MRLVVILTNVIFYIVNKMCQYTKHLYKVFFKWPIMMLQSHTWVKESFQVEDRLMDFKVTVRKVHQYGFRIHIATNPWETTTCGNLVNFPRRISKMLWKGYENHPPFSNYIWVWGWIFLPVLQPKHPITTDWLQK